MANMPDEKNHAGSGLDKAHPSGIIGHAKAKLSDLTAKLKPVAVNSDDGSPSEDPRTIIIPD